MTEYVVKEFTDELLNVTEVEWGKENKELFLVDFYDMFIAIKSDISCSDSSSHKYSYRGVFNSNNDTALAIVAMTSTDAVSLTKLLNIHFSPAVVARSDADEMAALYSAIISNSFEIVDLKDHVVKIYGRDQNLLKILKIVEQVGNQFLSQTKKFKMDGSWLTIRSA